MICGSGEESEIDLWGRIRPPLIYNSSLTITSSPSTDTPSIRTYNKTHEGIITCKPWVGKKNWEYNLDHFIIPRKRFLQSRNTICNTIPKSHIKVTRMKETITN